MDQAGQLDLEIGAAVAVDVALDDGLVVSGSGVVDFHEMQLALPTVEMSAANPQLNKMKMPIEGRYVKRSARNMAPTKFNNQ